MRRATGFVFIALFAASLSTGCVQHLAQLDMSDAGIRARVQTELKTHPELETSLLQVNVHVRIVYLSGIVRSYRMRRRIGETIRRVPGVQQVVNNLVITD
jgi:osmotically-inducible protein OsmY